MADGITKALRDRLLASYAPMIERALGTIAANDGVPGELSEEDAKIWLQKIDQDGDPSTLNIDEADKYLKDIGAGFAARTFALPALFQRKEASAPAGEAGSEMQSLPEYEKLPLRKLMDLRDQKIKEPTTFFGVMVRPAPGGATR